MSWTFFSIEAPIRIYELQEEEKGETKEKTRTHQPADSIKSQKKCNTMENLKQSYTILFET